MTDIEPELAPASKAAVLSDRAHSLNILLAAAAIAIVLLAATSAYSAWVSASSHKNSCARTNLLADAFHDVIVLALTPAPGQRLTAKQVTSIESFEAKAFARIDQARC